jgi:hypothetical protein
MALTNAQIRALDQYRRHWGRQKPCDDSADKKVGEAPDRLRSLANRLVALQRCFHESDALDGPFTRTQIGALVNAMLRPKLPVPRETLNGPLKSHMAHMSPDVKREHDSPISFFRDLLVKRELMTTEEWMYVLLKYHRIITISKDEDTTLSAGQGGVSWKSNRPLTAYRLCGIVLHETSKRSLKRYNAWAAKQIASLKGVCKKV